MSTKEVSKNEETRSTSVADLDMKLGVIVIPVSDVDRAAGDNFRVVQFTSPGSGSSIQFGVSLTPAAPGSAQAMHLLSPTSRRRAANSSHTASMRARCFTVRPERLAGFPASAHE